MIDTVQVVLLGVIVTLTVLLVVLGVQVFFLLKELRVTVGKTNTLLDTSNEIAENVAVPVESVSHLVDDVSTGAILSKAINIGLKAFSRSEGKGNGRQN